MNSPHIFEQMHAIENNFGEIDRTLFQYSFVNITLNNTLSIRFTNKIKS